MTTKVTVDAHAGWPVKVTKVCLGQDGKWMSQTYETVPPNKTEDFYVHGHMELYIQEMPQM